MNRILHPLAWLAFLFYYVSEDIVMGTLGWFGFCLSLTFVLSMAVCFYFFYLVVWERVIRHRQYYSLAIYLPLGVVIFIGTRFFFEEIVLRYLTGTGNYRDPYQWGYVWDNIFRPVSIILLSLVAWLLRRQNEFRENKAILEKEKTAAELAFLRSQINPHFLFNTLGFIQSRVYAADAEAAEITTELSMILRKAFSASEATETAVREELEMIQNLYGIMQKRFNGKCHVRFEIDESVKEKRIEPLLLMPLAENMFKHGDLRSADEPGSVMLKSVDRGLQISFENKIMLGDAHCGSGIGLENTRKRLELVYPESHCLEINSDSDRFTVELTLLGV